MVDISSTDVLECITCHNKFTPEDVKGLRFFASSGVCLSCYKNLQESGYAISCFGKRNLYGPGGKVLEFGFDIGAKACREECPDRKICQLFVSILRWRRGKMGKKKAAKELICPFRQNQSMTSKAWMMCATKGTMIDDLVLWVKRQGGEPRRVLRIMRSGHYLDVRWLVDEQNGFLKITYQGGGVGNRREESDEAKKR